MKRCLTILLALVLTLSMAIPAFAATEEADLEYIDTRKDVVFWVSWDVETPDIKFIAPNGAIYDPMKQANGTTTILNDKDLYYVIMNASAGQWRIRYDKGNNTKLDVSVHDYQAGLIIESFTIGEVTDIQLPYQFTVSGEEGTRYNYRISAMIDHTGMEKELASGSEIVGTEISGNVYLNNLSTYSGYMLKLYVWYDDNGTDIFDFAFSDKFSFTNEEADKLSADFHVTVMPEEQLLLISWPELPYNVEKVLVAVFEDGGKEPSVFDEYDPDQYDSVQLAYDPAAKQVDVEFTVTVNGVNAAPLRKTLNVGNFGISLPEGDAFNSLIIPLTYTGLTHQLTSVIINGYKTELVLDGSGSVNITVGDDWNEVSVSYSTGDNITWLIDRNIFVDRISPILTMSQAYDGMRSEKKTISVSGVAKDCASVTINGQPVTLDANGMFSQEIGLSTGGNTVTVVAADKLGNETKYTALIYHGDNMDEWLESEKNKSQPGGLLEILTGQGSYWILIAVSVLCLLVIGYALIFWRKEGEK